jgi:hypothetical protein
VKLPGGKTIIIEALALDTIAVVKAMIDMRTGIARRQLRLTFAGSQLEDGCTVSECNILHESTLYATLRLSGGGKRGRQASRPPLAPATRATLEEQTSELEEELGTLCSGCSRRTRQRG